jgi:hypothetical protein
VVVTAVVTGLMTRVQNEVGADIHFTVQAGEPLDSSRVFPPDVPGDEIRKRAQANASFLNDESLRNKSVKVGEQAIKVVAEGTRSDSVIITDMRVAVLGTSPAQGGTLISYGTEGTTNVQIGFDLASPRTDARTLGDTGKLGDRYFRRQSEPLKPGKPVVFAISVFPGPYTYTWELEVNVVIDGRPQVRKVRGPDQQPFKVTGYTCRYSEIYEFADRKSENDPFWGTADPTKWNPRTGTPCRKAQGHG